MLQALAPQDWSGAWVPVDVQSLNVQLTAASLPDDALPTDDCATLAAALQILHGKVSIEQAQTEAVDGMPLTTLTVNGDVIHTESFSTMTATVGTTGAANAITVTYTARQGPSGVEEYSIKMGTRAALKITARPGEPHLCVQGSIAAASF